MSTVEGRNGTNIALVLASSTGGVGRHVVSLAEGLVGRGHQVTVYGPAATERAFGFTTRGAAFRAVEIPADMHPVRDIAAVAALRRALAAERWPAVVHAHGLRAGLVAGMATAPRGRTPLVVTWHNVVLADGWRARLLSVAERQVARRADITLCASDDMIARALALGGRDVRPGPVGAPPLTPAQRDPAEVRKEFDAGDRPLVLSVGRLHAQKRHDALVAAAARWRDLSPTPLVVIAGDGPDEERLRHHIAGTGAPVRLLGHRDDVVDLLVACDLAVVASQWEARQLFAQEVLRAGRPLVATAVGGVPGMVGDAALLVPYDEKLVDALDDAVRRLLDDPALRSDLSERGVAQAATWPTPDDTVARVAAVYEELTGTGR